MRTLLLCDGGKVVETAQFCQTDQLGIEVQAFVRPVALEDPEQLAYHQTHVAGIAPLAMHAPFGDLCPGSFDPMVREVARVRLEQAYQIAEYLEVEHLVMHHGYVPHTSARANWITRSAAFWQAFCADKQSTMQFHLENLLELEPTIIADVIAAIDLPNVTINLDIGHAHCNSTTPVLTWIEALGDRIGYVHLHDNHGETDEHLGFGQGTIPFDEVCHALNACAPNAVWAIEAEGDGIAASLHWLQEHGFTPRRTDAKIIQPVADLDPAS